MPGSALFAALTVWSLSWFLDSYTWVVLLPRWRSLFHLFSNFFSTSSTSVSFLPPGRLPGSRNSGTVGRWTVGQSSRTNVACWGRFFFLWFLLINIFVQLLAGHLPFSGVWEFSFFLQSPNRTSRMNRKYTQKKFCNPACNASKSTFNLAKTETYVWNHTQRSLGTEAKCWENIGRYRPGVQAKYETAEWDLATQKAGSNSLIQSLTQSVSHMWVEEDGPVRLYQCVSSDHCSLTVSSTWSS